jgi:N-acetylglucosamine-6-phosphate deacetylase
MKAFCNAMIFDGFVEHNRHALLVDDAMVLGIVPDHDIPTGAERIVLDGGLIAPGFVDLQVNGGGGVLFNNDLSVEGIRTICKAHRRFGTTALLPTLITDRWDKTLLAIRTVEMALARGVEGCIGLHLEGPFLEPSRKGAHEPNLMRAATLADVAAIAASTIRPLLITLATEQATPAVINAFHMAGITVSIGHSDATVEAARAAADAGASMVTHLFNAMSPLTHRAPGLVGAALDDGRLWCGLIADGHHVAPEAIRIALRAKQGPARIVLVTDAMSTIGTDITNFTLNGREVTRAGGKLTLADGTLAGCDLDMITAVRFMSETIGLDRHEALRMASLYPAQAIGIASRYGHLQAGARADFVWLDSDLHVRATAIAGLLEGV